MCAALIARSGTSWLLATGIDSRVRRALEALSFHIDESRCVPVDADAIVVPGADAGREVTTTSKLRVDARVAAHADAAVLALDVLGLRGTRGFHVPDLEAVVTVDLRDVAAKARGLRAGRRSPLAPPHRVRDDVGAVLGVAGAVAAALDLGVDALEEELVVEEVLLDEGGGDVEQLLERLRRCLAGRFDENKLGFVARGVVAVDYAGLIVLTDGGKRNVQLRDGASAGFLAIVADEVDDALRAEDREQDDGVGWNGKSMGANHEALRR